MSRKIVKGSTIKPARANDSRYETLAVAGEAITAGQVLYVSGVSYGKLQLKVASPTDPVTCQGTLFIAKYSAASGQDFIATHLGLLEGKNTASMVVGQAVYLGAAGAISKTATGCCRVIGTVTSVHASTGGVAFDGRASGPEVNQRSGAVTLDMGGATHTLVLGTAGAAQTKLAGNLVFADAGGGAADLVLPAEASCAGLWLLILNTGGETITVENDAAGAVVAIPTAKSGMVACNGTSWVGLLGA